MGASPLVNSLVEEKDLDKTEKTYPLLVEQCQDCFLVQIVNPIDTHEIYQAQDYLYFTGEMPTTDKYFKEFAGYLMRYVEDDDLVVEIGSNDGTMLQNFTDQRVLGVDPSTNVVIRALAHGVPTLSAGFNEQNAKNIEKEWGKAKLIGGANCIAHIDDIHSLMEGVKVLLHDEGVFWVECNYWQRMVENVNYSLIYHDHYSYFNIKNWIDLASMYGLVVFDAEVTEAQGGSLRVYMAKNEIKQNIVTHRLADLVAKETNNYETCQTYNQNCHKEAQKLRETVQSLKAEGKSVAGYGAAAKGFSVLQLAQITDKEIDYFVDDSKAKQGKYTPVTHIPVISRIEAENKLPDVFFITAPNYKDVIMAKEKTFFEKGGQFLTTNSEIYGGNIRQGQAG